MKPIKKIISKKAIKELLGFWKMSGYGRFWVISFIAEKSQKMTYSELPVRTIRTESIPDGYIFSIHRIWPCRNHLNSASRKS